MVEPDDKCRRNEDSPIAVERKNHERTENVKVRFDSAAGDADEQCRHQHLRNCNDVTCDCCAWPGTCQPDWKNANRATYENCRPDVGMNRFALAAPSVRRNDDRHDDTGQPLAEHQLREELICL